MGSKAIKSLIAVLLLITLIPTLDVRADSVKDLYNFYDIDYDTEGWDIVEEKFENEEKENLCQH